MTSAKKFIKTTLLGGLVVILPVTIVFAVFRWIFYKVTGWIQPLTDQITSRLQMREILADAIVIAVIVLFCFLIGVLVKTSWGKLGYKWLEAKVLKLAPGYNLIKETLAQFLGRKKSPFSSVALVRIFENRAMATAFITDEHEDGSFTVFIPTGPNPTSGQIFHLPGDLVQEVDVGVEAAMRSIISCGAGSSTLISELNRDDAPKA